MAPALVAALIVAGAWAALAYVYERRFKGARGAAMSFAAAIFAMSFVLGIVLLAVIHDEDSSPPGCVFLPAIYGC
jgi:MFS family permease